jgi:hypothetical protein
MAKKMLILLVPLLAACASLTGTGGEVGPACKTHVCRVMVTVTGGCGIKVAPENLPIDPENKNVVIQWDVTGADFAKDGIVLKKGDPHGDFEKWAHGGPRTITVVDRHATLNVTYPYDVRVVQNGTACPGIDPTIMN